MVCCLLLVVCCSLSVCCVVVVVVVVVVVLVVVGGGGGVCCHGCRGCLVCGPRLIYLHSKLYVHKIYLCINMHNVRRQHEF